MNFGKLLSSLVVVSLLTGCATTTTTSYSSTPTQVPSHTRSIDLTSRARVTPASDLLARDISVPNGGDRGIPTPQPAREPFLTQPTPQPPLPYSGMPERASFMYRY